MHASGLHNWLPSLSQHFLVVTASLLVYVINARARRERRAPAAAIAWVMGLVLLPYVMLPLYLAFGRRKLSASSQTAPAAAGPEDAPHWAASLLGSFGLPPPAPAAVRFHTDGVAARASLWRLIDTARDTLDVCVFLIGNDSFGREAVARLAGRANAGVRVRLLYDGMSAWIAPRRALRALRAAGAQVAVFHPLLTLRRIGPRNLRNHRKYAIADGTRMWAGGRNLATEYFTGEAGAAPWLDLTFDLEGAVAASAARQFERDWAAANGDAPARDAPIRETAKARGTLTQFVPSGPDQDEDTAEALLVSACFRAQHRLLAITPYFVPDTSLQQALNLAARRGVQVTLLVPATSNHPLADFVRGRPLRELARAGARILLLPQMSHAKAVVVDDTLAIGGSINLDARSLLLNYESAVVFYGAAEIAWLAGWIGDRAAQGVPFDAAPPGLLRDLAEGALLAVAFQV
ncbi:MAG TPA: phospholipase D-like domain-containing protein [Steroidobacteraceae bacterium]|nr:phospholipase D-like domain-containing protein [Steroidobacteraceae bacterium]